MSHRRLLLSIVLLAASLLGCLSTTTPQSFTPTPAAGQLLSERSQVFFRKTAQQAEEVMVNDDRTASTGDEIWTQAQGRALLRFPDLWVRIYDDTMLRTEEVTPSGIKLAMGSGAVLIGETPRALEDVTIVLGSPPRARIVLTGTLVMIAYIPSEQVVLVRAFDGKADVSVIATGRSARADSDSAEWLIVGPENQLETPSQEDVRALARRVGLWDLYHAIELDAAGFGPPGASIPAEQVAITFVGTRTPALAPPTEAPPPSPEIHCQPKNVTVELGECAELSWDIRNAKAVYLNDAPANWHDIRKECPVASSVYSLRIETGEGDRYCDMTVDVLDTTPPLITDVRSELATLLPSGQKQPFCEKDRYRVSARVADLSKMAGVKLWCSRDCQDMKPAYEMTFDGEFYTAAITAGLCCDITAQDAAPRGNRATFRVPTVACQQVPTPSPTRTRTPTLVSTRTWTPTKVPTRTRTPPPPPTRQPTRAPAPDKQGPPAPGIAGPKNNVTLGCPPSRVILDWTAPRDPSGIASYRVRLQIKTAVWNDKKIWDPVKATQVNATGEMTCGGVYRWRILARDGAGNEGDVSDWAYFGIGID